MAEEETQAEEQEAEESNLDNSTDIPSTGEAGVSDEEAIAIAESRAQRGKELEDQSREEHRVNYLSVEHEEFFKARDEQDALQEQAKNNQDRSEAEKTEQFKRLAQEKKDIIAKQRGQRLEEEGKQPTNDKPGDLDRHGTGKTQASSAGQRGTAPAAPSGAGRGSVK